MSCVEITAAPGAMAVRDWKALNPATHPLPATRLACLPRHPSIQGPAHVDKCRICTFAVRTGDPGMEANRAALAEL
jgi:hypothetical protein